MSSASLFKRCLSVFLCLLLLLSCTGLSGCVVRRDNEKAEIIATIFPAYDFLRELTSGIDGFSIKLLLRPGTESHTYDPSVSDAVAISGCDLLVYAGGDADLWVAKFLSSGTGDRDRFFSMADAVPDKLLIDGEDEEDPHVWTDPGNVILIVLALRDRLIAVADSRSMGNDVRASIEANCDRFVNELTVLDNDFSALASRIPEEKRLLAFGDRYPFRYFCAAYGFSACAVFPGCSEESEPSASDVKKVVDAIRDNDLNTVFYVELSNHRIADAIAAETGCSTACLHSCHNLSRDDFDAGETYLTLMRRNLETLSKLMT